MKRALMLSLLFMALLVIPMISAEITEITIQTLPGYEVQVTASPSGAASFTALDRFIGNADDKGRASMNFSLATDFDLIIYIKLNGEKVSQGFSNPFKSTDNVPGEALYIELIPDWFVPEPMEEEEAIIETNDSEGELLIDEQEDEENKSVGTGLSIFGEGGIFSKRVGYISGGIILLALIIFFIVKLLIMQSRMVAGNPEVKSRKLSEINQKRINDLKKEIVDRENKIIELRKKKE